MTQRQVEFTGEIFKIYIKLFSIHCPEHVSLPSRQFHPSTDKFFHTYQGKHAHLGASHIYPSQLRLSQRSLLTLEENKILVNSTVDVMHLQLLNIPFFSSWSNSNIFDIVKKSWFYYEHNLFFHSIFTLFFSW